MRFIEIGLIPEILKALNDEGYVEPTPIQEKAIPVVLDQKDILGSAQTGTGKTAAFAIPILQLLNDKGNLNGRKQIRSLVLTPTRELAIQIDDSFKAYGKYTNIKNTVIFGGVGQNPQVERIRKGIDVLIATPGRLLDLVSQNIVSLKDIEIFVLDEADRMLDMGFIHDVKRLLKILPSKRQSLFFSATMPPEILKLADSILKNPFRVEVAPVSSTVDTIQQFVYFVDKGNKRLLLKEVLSIMNSKRVLVFTRTKYGADKIVRFLSNNKISSAAIHGNKSQNARQNALKNFKNSKIQVLVATDIAARGIDVDDLEYVINYEIPNESETYVHRIGRTGRAGALGTAYSFCDALEKTYLKDIEKLIKKKIPVVENHSFPMEDFNPDVKPKQQRPPRSKRNPKDGNRDKRNFRK